MKKVLVLITMVFATITANAQTALQESKLLDNVYVSAAAGVATPLLLDEIFPLNPTLTIAVGKQFTPVWGAEVEGTAWFGSHAYGGVDARFDHLTHHNAIRGSYVGVNGTVNLSNLFGGYKGTPRFFEVSTVLGAGWIHTFVPEVEDKARNYFGVKTGLDFAFNLGKEKKHTVSVRPSVLWDVTNPTNTMPLSFDATFAQLHLAVAYTYHFKTSNGTRHFKTYDVGALIEENNRLIAELERKPKVVKEIVKETVIKEVPVKTVVTLANTYEVSFTKGSAVLSSKALDTLDLIPKGTKVKVIGTASPEGSEDFNNELSQYRATAVADYLKGRGVEVVSAEGLGVTGEDSQRVAIVTVQ